MNVIWRCEVCGHCAGTAGDLRRHVWQEHAVAILEVNPDLVDALRALAERQEANRTRVLGADDRTPRH